MPEKLKRRRRQRALRESDRRILPRKPEVQSGRTKPSNVGAGKATRPSRDPDSEPPAHRGRHSVLDRQDRITSRAKSHPTEAFNNVFTLLTAELLWYAFRRLKRGKASGVDHVTVVEYEEKLQAKQLTYQKTLLAQAEKLVEDQRAITEKLSAVIEAAEKELRGDWDKCAGVVG